MAVDNSIELGDIAKDSITGFQGVVIGVTKWLHGCRRITLQPEKLSSEGKLLDNATFDEPQLIVVKRAKHATTSRTGGPGPVAAKRADAAR
jgi:hypothetical protein